MKTPAALLCTLLTLTSFAFGVPFMTVTSVQVSATDPAGPSTSSENTDPVSGQVEKTTGINATTATARYVVDDAGIGLSAQVTTGGAAGSSSELVFTFTTTKPIAIDATTDINQGTVSATFNNGPIPATAPAGSRTIRLTASSTGAVANANRGMFFDIFEDTSGNPDPDPGHNNVADTLTWRTYVNGLWDNDARWEPSFVPSSLDSISFKRIPTTAAQRTVPLPDIIVTSTGNAARVVKQMEVSRSAVNLHNFSLATVGGATVVSTLTIANGGRLTLDATAPLPASGHVDFSTTNAIIGLGTSQLIAPGKRLALAEMTIGPNVRWEDDGTFLVVGRTMNGRLAIESRFTDPNTSNFVDGPMSLGLAAGVRGILDVSGRLEADDILVGAARLGVGTVFVRKGGTLGSQDGLLASKKGSTAGVFVSDEVVNEPGTDRDYTSQGEHSEWAMTDLEMSGRANGGAGSTEGGESQLFITSGGIVTANQASLGNIRATNGIAAVEKATVFVVGHDPVDREVSFFTIFGPLVVGPFSPAEVNILDGAQVLPKSVAIGSRGRVFLQRAAKDENDVLIAKSRLDVSTDQGPRADGPVTIAGGGFIAMSGGTDLLCGDLTIGGIRRTVAALCRIDDSETTQELSLIETGDISVGNLGFPGLLDLNLPTIEAEQFISVDQGSTIRGTGELKFRNPAGQLTNRGSIIVPPGAGKVLRVGGDYVQASSGKLVITVNKTNVAPSAPFVVEGTNVQLNGTVELRFSGQHLPRKGQVYGLIRAENATTITNNATFKITGASARFDVIVEPFGVALVIK